jgi:hypothetical protein
MAEITQAGLIRGWVHVKSPTGTWESEGVRHFAQLPAVGEHFITGRGSEWCQARVIVHLPSEVEGADSDAEIYAVKVSSKEVLASG